MYRQVEPGDPSHSANGMTQGAFPWLAGGILTCQCGHRAVIRVGHAFECGNCYRRYPYAACTTGEVELFQSQYSGMELPEVPPTMPVASHRTRKFVPYTNKPLRAARATRAKVSKPGRRARDREDAVAIDL